MEGKHLNNLKLKYIISIIFRYVDDIIIFDDDKHNEERVAQELSSLNKNIIFTYEMETNNSINYLGAIN